MFTQTHYTESKRLRNAILTDKNRRGGGKIVLVSLVTIVVLMLNDKNNIRYINHAGHKHT
jgi:hypothetical protein